MGETVQYPEIKLPVGQLKGTTRTSIYNDNYYSFEGIPYGKPPVGELRFKAPMPAEPWTGVKDCTDFSIKPIQKNPVTGIVEGSEDCLYLNVYAKTLNSPKPLPVLVWIYGGSFLFGEATRHMYSPDYFMSEDVVVVTFNYRLCSLGFLSVADPSVDVPGNAGIKDQVLALRWVKQYIQHFNGDPENITVFGDSAGGASTHFLTGTQQTKGLFHKAICMSGTMLNSWSITPPKDYAYRLAKENGYQGENKDVKVIEFLRSLEPAKLIRDDLLDDEDKRNGVSFMFGPCIEPYVSESCVVPEHPRNMLATAWTNNIPIMFGGTSDEGLLIYPKYKMFPQMSKAYELDPERLLPNEVRVSNDKAKNLELAKKISENHFGDKGPNGSDLHKIVYYSGIKMFWHGVHRSILARLKHSTGPTYLYRFAFDSPTFNHHRKRFCGNDIKNGVAHADDISYLWYAFYAWKLDTNTKEYQTLQRMVKIFVDFAKSSTLNNEFELCGLANVDKTIQWKPLKATDPYEALNIDEKLELKTIPEKNDLLLWDSIYEADQLLEYQNLTLPLGQIGGALRTTIYNDIYYSFEGIPYAQPPVGELRFKAPLPAKPWKGIKDCTDFNVKPIQINKFKGEVEGSEDCLYLNVYTKKLYSLMLLPVMVYIFGGGFNNGAATRALYSPDYFMQKDVVIVTLNYRLDSLGFLSIKDPTLEIPGNAGLKDQILALKWVKKYIRYFNGDPDNITLFGNSVGAASVHYLTATNQTRGLFHKAICMSGTMLNSRATTPPHDYAFRLAQQHGYKGENIDEKVVRYLQSLDAKKLVQHKLLTNEDRRNGIRLTFAPVVEPYVGIDTVVPFEQSQMLKTAWGNNIPIMFSGVVDEGLLLYSQVKTYTNVVESFRRDPVTILPYLVKQKCGEEECLELADRLFNSYFGDKNASLADVIHYYSIRDFWHGLHRSLLSRLKYAKAPTYLYRFPFDSPTFNHYRQKHTKGEITTGVAHADDLSYLWYGEHSWKLDKCSAEYKTIQRMVDIFTNFATSRDYHHQLVYDDKCNHYPFIWYYNIQPGASSSVRFCSAIRSGRRIVATMDSGEEKPIIKITQGLVRGTKSKTLYDDDYYSFEGIPYGQPPLGELRFKAPLPAQPWDSVKDCFEFNVKPLQKNYQGEIEGSEDCLYLNVYAKRLNAKEKLPVLVYIYGGAFNTGNCTKSKYGPDYFMQEDVILVTFNYRVSVLGFLSLKDPSLNVAGNAGLKDQVLALKWVQQNIAQFGGNNENITLFGESAGAASVHFMMCTDQTKGLFHKAICMSGCILNNWALTKDTTDLPYKLACEKGYQGDNNDRDVLEFLKQCPASELLHMDKLNQEVILKGGFFVFVPSMEPYDNPEAVVRKPLLESMKTSWGNSIPLIIGGTSFEGLVRYPQVKHKPELLNLYKTRPELLVPPELLVGKTDEEAKSLGNILYDLYFKAAEGDEKQYLMKYLDHCSFYSIWHDLHRVIRSRKELATAPTYQYLFDFDSPTFNHHRKMFCGTDIEEGVAHADDLEYLFYAFYSWKLEKDSKEYLTIRRMIELWTQFAKTSNPNCQYTKNSEWKTITESDIKQWLRISNDIRFEEISKEFQNKLDVWNSLYDKDLF
ncbi:uncharacterized protein LOC133330663 [Musca vetustissima]|uniref:uncharacterized protein LOC133330663 n=1 Tax=Musca vetustissima TaxID=27455 RepID=UPI002AB6157E|nr:uncharacterized protein LOC133330663 [Musca vetustissima]